MSDLMDHTAAGWAVADSIVAAEVVQGRTAVAVAGGEDLPGNAVDLGDGRRREQVDNSSAGAEVSRRVCASIPLMEFLE